MLEAKEKEGAGGRVETGRVATGRRGSRPGDGASEKCQNTDASTKSRRKYPSKKKQFSRSSGSSDPDIDANATCSEDFLEHLFVGTNHQYMLFFTQKGKCFWMRVYEIPEGSKTSKGRAIQNLINIEQDDKVKAFICTQDLKDEDYINSQYVIMATKKGQVKKTSLEQYSRPRTNGINAITIKEDDELLEAKLTTGESQVMLALKSGKAIRFEEAKTRPMGRGASGVRGITLAHDSDEVIGMIAVDDMESNILVVSENGYGKRSSLEDYRITNRGGKGHW